MKNKPSNIISTPVLVFIALIIFGAMSVTAAPVLRRNGKIAFTSNRDGNREIYVMNANGTNQVRITNNALVDDHPTWSPDGLKIAFVSERTNGGRAIFTMNPDGTGRTEIAPVNYFDRYSNWPRLIWTDYYSMDWSPDGTQIVFQDNYDIVIVNSDGSNRHAITDGNAYDLEPAWSPDGSKIVFSRDPIDDGGLQYGRMSTMSNGGSNIQFLPNAWQWQEYAPKWSPSGNKILFVIEFTDEIPDSVIYITDADGSNDQLFDGSPDGIYEYRNKPSWSPDETKILFDKWAFGTGYPGDLEIFVKKIDGTGFTQLTNTNGWNFNPSWQPLVTARTFADFDGDGRADISVFRPSDKSWYLNRSTHGFSATQFGLSADKITPADYDGDGTTDIAVYRDGVWYWLNSLNNSFNAIPFGLPNDIPRPADFDGDGKAELAVYRSGIWYTLNPANNQFKAVQFGIATDKPVAADYDGDGRADFAVYRDGTWYLLQSTQGFAAIQFGLPSDKLVPADYDGDGKTDQAVYRDGTWYLLRSNLGFAAFPFGLATDTPVPADYDGDGTTDAAVYRDGVWYMQQSTSGFAAQQFGLTNDKPIPSAYLP